MKFIDALKVAISNLQAPQEGVVVPETILTFSEKLASVIDENPSALHGALSPALQAILNTIIADAPDKTSVKMTNQLIHWFGLAQLSIPPEVYFTPRETRIKRFNELYAKVIPDPLEDTRVHLMNTMMDIVTEYEFGILQLECLFRQLAEIFGQDSVTDALLIRVAANTSNLMSPDEVSTYEHEVEEYLITIGIRALHSVSSSMGLSHPDVSILVPTLLKHNREASLLLLKLVDLNTIMQSVPRGTLVAHNCVVGLKNIVTEAHDIARTLFSIWKALDAKAAEPIDVRENPEKGSTFNLNVRMVGNPNHQRPPMEEVAHTLLETQNRNDAAVRESLDRLKGNLESVVSKIPNEYQGEVSKRVAVVISLFDNEHARELLPSFESEFRVAITGNIMAGRIDAGDLAKLMMPFLDRWIEVLHDRING